MPSSILSCAHLVLLHMNTKNQENAQNVEVWYSLVELMTHIDKTGIQGNNADNQAIFQHCLILTERDTILVLQNRWHSVDLGPSFSQAVQEPQDAGDQNQLEQDTINPAGCHGIWNLSINTYC